MCGSPRLDSPLLFPALPSAPFLLPPVPEVRGKPAHSANREHGLHRRVLPLHSYGKRNLRKFFLVRLGEGFQLGMLICTP